MKNYITIISLLLLSSICFACNNKVAITQTETTQTETTSIISETKIEKIIGMPNPMVPYDTFEELSKACDFKILYPSDTKNYTEFKYFLISDNLADCRLTDKNNKDIEITYRSSKGNNDISGYHGFTPTNSKINDVEVHTYKTDDGFATWWTNNDMAYSISAKNINENEYKTLLEDAIKLTK